MNDYELSVEGTAGSPVLLLPGGASTSRGFFPGLPEALAGHRILSLDRPGTGLAWDRGPATLASGAAAAADALKVLGGGPAVVVAQSLGGPVALQLAIDHPESVAGLVLIDPTPIDLPALYPTLAALFTVVSLPGRLPVVGARLERLMWRAMSARVPVAEGAHDGREAMIGSASLAVTARAVRSLRADAAALASRLRPLDLPAVILTADRKSTDKIRQSHERLATRIGARLVAPPQAVHAEHLRDPAAVNQLVAALIAEVEVPA